METAILILKDTLNQQEKQLREAREFQKQKGESLIITKAIENLTKVIAELMYAIYILRRARAETSNENGALPIPDVSGSLPEPTMQELEDMIDYINTQVAADQLDDFMDKAGKLNNFVKKYQRQ